MPPTLEEIQAAIARMRDVVVAEDGQVDLRQFGCKPGQAVRLLVLTADVGGEAAEEDKLLKPIRAQWAELDEKRLDEKMLRKFGSKTFMSPGQGPGDGAGEGR